MSKESIARGPNRRKSRYHAHFAPIPQYPTMLQSV